VTVFLPTVVIVLVTYGKFFTIANRREALLRDSQIGKIVFCHLRSLCSQGQIVFRGSALVAVAFDLNRRRRILLQPFCVGCKRSAEGKNIVIELRFGEGKFERAPALAAELVRLKVDIIVSAGQTVTRDAKEATSTIPIVMMQVGDPVGSGFVASLARPGGNIAGLSGLAPELSGKRLELLKEIVPKLSRVAVLGSSTEPDNAQSLREVERAAKALDVKLQYLDVLSPKDIETAFRAAVKGGLRQSLCSPNSSRLCNSSRAMLMLSQAFF
jgi:ABC-type uncharacterized transport system substrate-binding protein